VVVVSRNRAPCTGAAWNPSRSPRDARPLQIIVVDNGSSDGSAQLDTESFAQAQFIRLPKELRLTKAMNIGWRAADAEYVFFLHDDPRWSPERPPSGRDAGCEPQRLRACPLLVDDAGQPAPQTGALPPGGEWLEAEISGSQPEAGRVSARRGPHDARLRHPGGSPDRRALRPVRRRRGPGGADPEGLEADPPGARGAACAIVWVAPATRPWSAPIFCSAGGSLWESTWGSGLVCGHVWRRLRPLLSFRFGELATRWRVRRSTARNRDALPCRTACRHGCRHGTRER